MTEWLRLIRYTSWAILARSARSCGVFLPHLLGVGAQDRLDELFTVPDLQGWALDMCGPYRIRTCDAQIKSLFSPPAATWADGPKPPLTRSFVYPPLPSFPPCSPAVCGTVAGP